MSIFSTTQPKSAPGVTRTPDLRIRNPLLYPAELRAQSCFCDFVDGMLTLSRQSATICEYEASNTRGSSIPAQQNTSLLSRPASVWARPQIFQDAERGRHGAAPANHIARARWTRGSWSAAERV